MQGMYIVLELTMYDIVCTYVYTSVGLQVCMYRRMYACMSVSTSSNVVMK